jgi:hypothetical protein
MRIIECIARAQPHERRRLGLEGFGGLGDITAILNLPSQTIQLPRHVVYIHVVVRTALGTSHHPARVVACLSHICTS